MDGHTLEGRWPVTLELTADQVEMLVRSIRVAVLTNGAVGETMEVIAYREFLKEIIGLLETALEEQQP